MKKESYIIVRYMEKPYFFEGVDDNERAVWRSDLKAALAFGNSNGAKNEAEDNELRHYKIEPASKFMK